MSTKTSEQLAKEWLKTFPEGGDCCEIAFLAGYKAAAPQWISVKERLPPEQEDKLLFLSIYKDVYLGWIELVSTDDGQFHLTYSEGHGYLDRADRLISHWMPLPAPPKEEK